MSAEEAQSALGEQRVAAMIVVPENFDEAVSAGNGIVDLYLNNVDIDLSDDLRRSVTRSVAEFDAPQLALLGELHGPSEGVILPNAYRVAVNERDMRDTNVSFLQYQVIPIVVLIVISCGLLGTALLTARDFARHTVKVMLLSPTGRLSLVLGRLLGGLLITGALVLPLMGLGFLTQYLPVPSGTHLLALAALLLAVSVATVGLGTLLGVWVRDERLVTMTGLNLAVYLFFLGGGFTTVAFLPKWIQNVSEFVPTKYAIEGLRQALFYPDLIGFGQDLLILSLCAAGAVLLSAMTLTRAWRRA
jgi:ABC-type multidrug transport system permease subunit